jgi:adenosylhomocysteinase
VAQSDVKLLITYPEIAESCVRRISELLGSEKLRGRSVLLVGYGTAGRDIAHRLRDRGCIVTVVDNDVLKLILAAENGFRSFRSVHAALRATQPFLVIGCTGDIAFDEEAFDAIPDGSFITGIATRDLDRLRFDVYDPIHLPRIGTLHRRHNRRFTQLGDGRSVNLFESEAIPNSANDVFKTAIFLATAHLASQFSRLRPGLHLQAVNDLIQESGLLDAYYELYLRDVEDHEETP